MAATFNFAATQLPVGKTIVGPSSDTNFATATISINRTGSGNHPWLSKLTAASVLDVLIQSSPDGAVWNDEVEAAVTGGPWTDKNGTVNPPWTLEVNGVDPAATAVRAVLTVSGPSPVEVSGTVTTT